MVGIYTTIHTVAGAARADFVASTVVTRMMMCCYGHVPLVQVSYNYYTSVWFLSNTALGLWSLVV